MNLTCRICNKFVAYTKAYRVTPFGQATDIEPPEEQLICFDCWEPKRTRVWWRWAAPLEGP